MHYFFGFAGFGAGCQIFAIRPAASVDCPSHAPANTSIGDWVPENFQNPRFLKESAVPYFVLRQPAFTFRSRIVTDITRSRNARCKNRRWREPCLNQDLPAPQPSFFSYFFFSVRRCFRCHPFPRHVLVPIHVTPARIAGIASTAQKMAANVGFANSTSSACQMKRPLLIVLALSLAQLLGPLAQNVESSQQPTANRTTGTKIGFGQTPSNLSPSQVFSRSRSSVVVIVASSENEQGLVSGFIVGDDKIVTNHHVLEGMSEAFVVFSDGKVQPVSEVIAASAEQDLMILRVQTGHRRSLSLGDELSLNEGDPVYAIGSPKGLQLSFTNGIVSSFRKSSSQILIQTTAPIAPGSSGGPLLDKSGLVVGVTTSRIEDAPGIYFSVGSGDVRRLMRTPYGVALTLADWAKQQHSKPTDSARGRGPNHSHDTPNGAPTLDETLAWMSDFAKRHLRVVPGSGFGRHLESFEQVQGCNVRFTDQWTYPRGWGSSGTIDTFTLGDIDPSRIYVSDQDYSVNLWTSRDAPLIHEKDLGLDHLFESYFTELYFDSVENAERFATDFKHAVTLCGGVKEPF